MSVADVTPLRETAAALVNLCYRILDDYECAYTDENISIDKIVEVINFAYRDLTRISADLSDAVSREKFSAYHAFWFSKLKPLSGVQRTDATDEIVDINERVAVRIAIEWMRAGAGTPGAPDVQAYPPAEARKVGHELPPAPLVWEKCERVCRGVCFEQGAINYLKYHHNQNFEYLVHSLRHRSVSPYILVTVLESIVITSCQYLRDNPAIVLA